MPGTTKPNCMSVIITFVDWRSINGSWTGYCVIFITF